MSALHPSAFPSAKYADGLTGYTAADLRWWLAHWQEEMTRGWDEEEQAAFQWAADLVMAEMTMRQLNTSQFISQKEASTSLPPAASVLQLGEQ